MVQPRTITAKDVQPEYDLILLAPKSYDLDDALQSLKGALGQGTVLPFLNGRDHLDTLDAMLGQERVMGGVAHIAATITTEGAIRQLTEMHRLTVGARHPSHQQVASDFIELCRKAPFDSVLADDIEQVLWEKWVFLATLAGMFLVTPRRWISESDRTSAKRFVWLFLSISAKAKASEDLFVSTRVR